MDFNVGVVVVLVTLSELVDVVFGIVVDFNVGVVVVFVALSELVDVGFGVVVDFNVGVVVVLDLEVLLVVVTFTGVVADFGVVDWLAGEVVIFNVVEEGVGEELFMISLSTWCSSSEILVNFNFASEKKKL